MNGYFKIFANQLLEHRPRTTAGKVKQREQRGRDAPDPMLVAVVLEAGFVAAKLRLLGNRQLEFFVSAGERIRNDTVAQL